MASIIQGVNVSQENDIEALQHLLNKCKNEHERQTVTRRIQTLRTGTGANVKRVPEAIGSSRQNSVQSQSSLSQDNVSGGSFESQDLKSSEQMSSGELMPLLLGLIGSSKEGRGKSGSESVSRNQGISSESQVNNKSYDSCSLERQNIVGNGNQDILNVEESDGDEFSSAEETLFDSGTESGDDPVCLTSVDAQPNNSGNKGKEISQTAVNSSGLMNKGGKEMVLGATVLPQSHKYGFDGHSKTANPSSAPNRYVSSLMASQDKSPVMPSSLGEHEVNSLGESQSSSGKGIAKKIDIALSLLRDSIIEDPSFVAQRLQAVVGGNEPTNPANKGENNKENLYAMIERLKSQVNDPSTRMTEENLKKENWPSVCSAHKPPDIVPTQLVRSTSNPYVPTAFAPYRRQDVIEPKLKYENITNPLQEQKKESKEDGPTTSEGTETQAPWKLRAAKRRAKGRSHTVGVSEEELAEVRKYLQQTSSQENPGKVEEASEGVKIGPLGISQFTDLSIKNLPRPFIPSSGLHFGGGSSNFNQFKIRPFRTLSLDNPDASRTFFTPSEFIQRAAQKAAIKKQFSQDDCLDDVFTSSTPTCELPLGLPRTYHGSGALGGSSTENITNDTINANEMNTTKLTLDGGARRSSKGNIRSFSQDEDGTGLTAASNAHENLPPEDSYDHAFTELEHSRQMMSKTESKGPSQSSRVLRYKNKAERNKRMKRANTIDIPQLPGNLLQNLSDSDNEHEDSENSPERETYVKYSSPVDEPVSSVMAKFGDYAKDKNSSGLNPPENVWKSNFSNLKTSFESSSQGSSPSLSPCPQNKKLLADMMPGHNKSNELPHKPVWAAQKSPQIPAHVKNKLQVFEDKSVPEKRDPKASKQTVMINNTHSSSPFIKPMPSNFSANKSALSFQEKLPSGNEVLQTGPPFLKDVATKPNSNYLQGVRKHFEGQSQQPRSNRVPIKPQVPAVPPVKIQSGNINDRNHFQNASIGQALNTKPVPRPRGGTPTIKMMSTGPPTSGTKSPNQDKMELPWAKKEPEDTKRVRISKAIFEQFNTPVASVKPQIGSKSVQFTNQVPTALKQEVSRTPPDIFSNRTQTKRNNFEQFQKYGKLPEASNSRVSHSPQAFGSDNIPQGIQGQLPKKNILGARATRSLDEMANISDFENDYNPYSYSYNVNCSQPQVFQKAVPSPASDNVVRPSVARESPAQEGTELEDSEDTPNQGSSCEDSNEEILAVDNSKKHEFTPVVSKVMKGPQKQIANMTSRVASIGEEIAPHSRIASARSNIRNILSQYNAEEDTTVKHAPPFLKYVGEVSNQNEGALSHLPPLTRSRSGGAILSQVQNFNRLSQEASASNEIAEISKKTPQTNNIPRQKSFSEFPRLSRAPPLKKITIQTTFNIDENDSPESINEETFKSYRAFPVSDHLQRTGSGTSLFNRAQTLFLNAQDQMPSNVQKSIKVKPKSSRPRNLFPKQFEAQMSPGSADKKQKEIEAYFQSGLKKNEIRKSASVGKIMTHKSNLNEGTEDVDQVFESLFRASGHALQKQPSSEATKSVNAGGGRGRGVTSPFQKFKQLDHSTNPKAKEGSPIFKFTNPGLRQNASNAKDILLYWCQCRTRDYQNVNIENFSSSWSDGLAFCALIHHFYPDAFDFDSLDGRKRRENFDIAFKTAQEKAGIYPLLDTDDMVAMGRRPDWKCVFTYVQSMYQVLKDM